MEITDDQANNFLERMKGTISTSGFEIIPINLSGIC
jgi:hypothetical protein